jgi:ComF family protein
MTVDTVVPVPLHKRRLRRRGFNQAAYLAREFAKRVGLTVDEGVLVRHRATAAQVDLNAEQRRENVRRAFRSIGYGVVGKRVLLIDDVCTTGSTLEACAIALTQGGAESVQALTLARAR